MTVYVVQRATYREAGIVKDKYDLTPAEAFGELEELLDPWAKPFDTAPILDTLFEKLDGFSDEDFIICIGNPILLALAVSVAVDVNDGRVNLLQWNGRQKEYVPVNADLGFTADD